MPAMDQDMRHLIFKKSKKPASELNSLQCIQRYAEITEDMKHLIRAKWKRLAVELNSLQSMKDCNEKGWNTCAVY